MKKGMKLKDWVFAPPMDGRNITTARVFLILGFVFGIIEGICGTMLFLLFTNLTTLCI